MEISIDRTSPFLSPVWKSAQEVFGPRAESVFQEAVDRGISWLDRAPNDNKLTLEQIVALQLSLLLDEGLSPNGLSV